MTAVADIDWSRHVADRSSTGQTVPLRPAVQAGIDQLRADFVDHTVLAWPTGDGGAAVVIEGMRLGPRWAQQHTWLGFHLGPLYADSDVYPHYVAADLTHTDGAALAPPLHAGNSFDGVPAIMVSRRSPRPENGVDAAARKARSVLRFVSVTG